MSDNEATRLAALRRYEILDTAPEAAYEDFVWLAAHACGVPMALISLVEEDRQWFKAKVGLDLCETSRDVSFCSHALRRPGLFIVPDASRDPRFVDNPLVAGDPHIRFYAGAPLITPEGHTLGALCVMDQVPRVLTQVQQDSLQALARQVVTQLELRRSLAERAKAERALRESQALNSALLDASLDCIITIDEQERVREWNPAAEKTFGYPRAQALGRPLSDLIIPGALRAAHKRGMAHFLATGEGPVLNQRVKIPALRADGTEFPAELTALAIRLDDRVLFTAYVRDITERTRAEDALRQAHDELERRVEERTAQLAQAERDYRSLFENAVEGIFQTTTDGHYLKANPALARIYGYDSPEELGRALHDIAKSLYIDPGRRGVFARLMQERGVITGFESAVRCKDGSVIWISENARAILDECGEIVRYEGTVIDITARRRAEEALRESEARFLSIVTNTPGMVYRFVLRPDGTTAFPFVSDGCREVYGLDPQDVQRDAGLVLGTIPDEERAEFMASVLASAQTLQPWNWDRRITRPDGSERWIQAAARPRRQDNGDVVWDGVVMDVTERHQAEEALRQSEVRYGGLVDSSPEAVFVYRENTIVYANPAAMALFGASQPAELLGRCVFDIIHPDTLPIARERARRTQEEGLPSSLAEQKYLRLDGTTIHVESVSTAITWDDRPAGQVLARDITERIHAEEALRERTQILSNILSAIPHLVFWKDTELVYQGGNVNFARAAGLARAEEVVGKTDHDLPWAAEEAAEYRALDRRVITRGEPILNVEQTLLRADGVTMTGLTSKIPLRDEAGHIIGVLGIYHDISERRQAEDALRASEERLRTVVGGMPMILFALDGDGVIILSDGRGLNALGLKPGEDVGKSMLDLYGEYPDVQAAIRRALSGETVSIFQEFAAAVFETQFIPQYDDLGRTSGVIGVAMDVTERQWAEREILKLNSQLEQRLDRIILLNHELAQAYDATIEGWSRALDLRDHETEGHSQRVTEMTVRLAQAFGVGDEEMVHVRRGALLHDIGKMGVPDAVLLKPGPLTDSEWRVMRRHPDHACEMLSPIAFLRPALDIPHGHHEKWDGTGYPRRLSGESIPLAARLFAVVDVWDALRSDRPYRRAWTVERTREHIAALAGTHFDPQVVPVFLSLVGGDSEAQAPVRQAA